MQSVSTVCRVRVPAPRFFRDCYYRSFTTTRRQRLRVVAQSNSRSRLMEVDEETKLKRIEEKKASKAAGLVKRKVALHIGYVGTQYSGLQLSQLENVKTIEGVLHEALCKSGCVSEANSVSLFKVKWSRSSRTDKGVHALATVIAMKCLLDESKFDTDPEGLELADLISSFLPSEIRVFSVQRVNDGFFARKACATRTYTYFVPLFLLTDSQEEREEESLVLFRKALKMFCGRHPFHNYTKRKQYIENNDPWSYGKKKRKQESQQVLEEDDEEEEDTIIASPVQTQPSKSSTVDYFEDWRQIEEETGRWRFWKYEFKEQDDPTDHVVAAHYRYIIDFTAEQPAPVIPGGVKCVQCMVKGQSFMLHQIRHMIGTAIGFARKKISEKVLESSLKACIRINLPLALPQPLILQDNEFSDFPGNNGEPAVVSKWSGPRLELRSGGLAKQAKFSDTLMMPEINALLELPDWVRWSEQLSLITYDECLHEDVRLTVEKFDQWVSEKREIKKAKEISLQQELDAKGIDRETWMKERSDNKRKAISKKAKHDDK